MSVSLQTHPLLADEQFLRLAALRRKHRLQETQAFLPELGALRHRYSSSLMHEKPGLKQSLLAYLEKRKVWHDNPERYCRERLNLRPTWQQLKVLEAIQPEGSRVSIRSGHGIGKDAISAGIILWFMETRDFPRIPCTAPTGHQLYDILWGEIAKWMRRSEEMSRAKQEDECFWLTHIFEHTQDKLYDVLAPKEWYAVARTARKDAPAGLQGFHATDIEIDDDGNVHHLSDAANILVVIDEASGVPDEIYEVLEGALSSPGARQLELGNPTQNTGQFAAHHKQHRGEFTTLHFRSQDSPLVDPEYRARLVRKFGEGSNVVRVRCDGEFPKADDDTLIPLEWCENALYATGTIPTGGRKRLGVDVARHGDDRIAYLCRHGNIVSHIEIDAKQDTMVTVGRSVTIAEKLQVDDICVDVIGLGAGVYDRLVEVMAERKGSGLWACDVLEVNVAEKAPTRDTEDDGQGKTLRDYLWLEARSWLRDEAPAFIAEQDYCEDLAGELSTPKFKLDSSGRIVVEAKDELKKRTQGRSPDLADALCCTFAPYDMGSWSFV